MKSLTIFIGINSFFFFNIMKVISLFTIITTTILLPFIGSSTGALLHRNIEQANNENTIIQDNNATLSNIDLNKLNGTWYVISMEKDIYKKMQKVAENCNATCICPELILTPNGPDSLDANATCTLQSQGKTIQLLSHGLLTLLPEHPSKKKKHIKNELSLALLFSQPFIISNDNTTVSQNGDQCNSLPNINQEGVQPPSIDSGVKGKIHWTFYPIKNSSSQDEAAFVRTKDMISANDKDDVPDVNMLLSKDLSTFDDATYNATANSIPDMGEDYQYDYMKLDKCNFNSTGGQQPEPTSSETGGNNQPTETSTENGSQQPKATESSTENGGQQHQPADANGNQ
ncbi:uncharacterized protein BX664DRAFT_324322 [Halteromyces radiatus]|uniref:uncharacterized protein n=1 Tax=Halteromyces radiatus TaxID=101107 RepID=UPI002220853D|nr:uncharacterized protein BX664DRAFT_324322 [Halteromyces radiatus]KAI8096583.1 hypothetical protein BX664DRAFT_324322 [Halteromyces radiatus]